ncbi:MAG: hypothetical protein LBF85_10225, partial [Tannerella sp.]|nr:hypothetical protein [Tannerella sp.]
RTEKIPAQKVIFDNVSGDFISRRTSFLAPSGVVPAPSEDILAFCDSDPARSEDIFAFCEEILAQSENILARSEEILARSQDFLAFTDSVPAFSDKMAVSGLSGADITADNRLFIRKGGHAFPVFL